MNFGRLLNVAEKNRSASAAEKTVKRYSTEVAPAKKPPKSNVQSAAIRAFLQRKEFEEKQKAIDEKRKKEKLLELRAQNAKSNKRAKVMASRTKDNDFSRIRLTEDEEEARRKREAEFQRKMLTDKVERMKARIKLQQEEDCQPHKRKRKRRSSTGEPIGSDDGAPPPKSEPHLRKPRKRKYEIYTGEEEEPKEERRPHARPKGNRPPPPMVDYHDLLKLANAKQHEPVVIERLAPDTTEANRPLTKQEKERRMEEELHKKGVKVPSKFPPAKRKESGSSRTSEKGGVLNGKPPSSDKSSSQPPSKHQERQHSSSKSHERQQPAAKVQEKPAANDKFQERQREIAERQRRMAEEERQLEEMEHRIAQERKVVEEERKLAEMERRIAERRKEIARKQRELAEKDPKTADLKRGSSGDKTSGAARKEEPPAVRPSLDRKPDIKMAVERKQVPRESVEKRKATLEEKSKSVEGAHRTSSTTKKPAASLSLRDPCRNGLGSSKPAETRPAFAKSLTPKVQRSQSSSATSSKPEDKDSQDEDGDTFYAYSQKPKAPLLGLARKSTPMSGPPSSSKRPALPSSEKSSSGKGDSCTQKSSVPSRSKEEERRKTPEKPTATSSKISAEELARRKELALRTKQKLEQEKEKERVKQKQVVAPSAAAKKSYEEQYEDLYRRLQGSEYIDSEEEDDEYEDEEDDMDDFIDDTPQAGNLDYSKHIREIFGYDRTKFEGDDDDEAMESSYAQQMKEEVRSARIGLKEDIEDMKREEEELRKKQMKKLEMMRKMHRKL